MSDVSKIGETKLSTVMDPFNKSSIEEIFVCYKKHMFSGEWYSYGVVEFKKGNTSGKQKFDGATFDEVVLKIKNFINDEL